MGSASTSVITPEWSDEELIDYCATHCKTERALFHRDHILRMERLATPGGPVSTDLPEWVTAHADSMMPLVVHARIELAARAKPKPPADPKPDAQAALRDLAINACPIGVYAHRKGGTYVVYSHSVDESTLAALAHYYNVIDGTRWTLTVESFIKEVAGRPHFERVGDVTDEMLVRAREDVACQTGLYAHRKGGSYVLYDRTLYDGTLAELFHYYSVAKGTRWTRTVANFIEQVSGEPRFKRERDATPAELHVARSALL